MEFKPFSKIARLKRTVIVTEKIDGTNAQINIVKSPESVPGEIARQSEWQLSMFAGSRSRGVTPEQDNFGFAQWCVEHAAELFKLGPGAHFGEWLGSGIQRGYGLPQGEKRLSLFNTYRWKDGCPATCCSVVPILLQHEYDGDKIEEAIDLLRINGSQAAPGFMDPEGIVLFHTASSTLYKYTLDGDGHKG